MSRMGVQLHSYFNCIVNKESTPHHDVTFITSSIAHPVLFALEACIHQVLASLAAREQLEDWMSDEELALAPVGNHINRLVGQC